MPSTPTIFLSYATEISDGMFFEGQKTSVVVLVHQIAWSLEKLNQIKLGFSHYSSILIKRKAVRGAT